MKFYKIAQIFFAIWILFQWICKTIDGKISPSDSIIISLLFLIYFAITKK